MAKNKSENYLDNLLNSISERDSVDEEEFSLDMESSDDFLREFENELVSEEYSSYMADFELEMESEKNKNMDLLSNEESPEFDIEEFSLDEAIEKLEHQNKSLDPISVSDTQSPKDILGSQIEEQDEIGELDQALLSAAKEAEDSIIEEIGEPDLAGNSGSDLMDLLGEDGGLADIGSLLMEGEEISEASEEAFDELAQKEVEEATQNQAEVAKETDKKEKKAEKKGGFFS